MTQFLHYQQAVELLRKSEFPLFVLLENVDADALGATIALVDAVRQQGANPTIFCLAPVPDFLTFLLFDHSVIQDSSLLEWSKFDAAIIPDTGSLSRTGIAADLNDFKSSGRPILNIDHHYVHEDFGTINLVDEAASATTELVYDILKLGDWKFTAEIATSILAGLIADTGNFTNAGTRVRSLAIAAECYAKGAHVSQVLRSLYQNKPIEALQFWGEVLSRLQKHPRWGIVATVILQDDFKKYRVADEAADGIANFMNTMTGVQAALVLTELPDGLIRGGLRTTKDTVDVSKLAAILGGGGHKKAAGFTVPGKILRSETGWRVE